jgi:hypothetical protein
MESLFGLIDFLISLYRVVILWVDYVGASEEDETSASFFLEC